MKLNFYKFKVLRSRTARDQLIFAETAPDVLELAGKSLNFTSTD